LIWLASVTPPFFTGNLGLKPRLPASQAQLWGNGNDTPSSNIQFHCQFHRHEPSLQDAMTEVVIDADHVLAPAQAERGAANILGVMRIPYLLIAGSSSPTAVIPIQR
jgi:hypothetical protein